MLFIYNFLLLLYRLAIGIVSPFNGKARKWIEGRKGWEGKMSSVLAPHEKRIWIHCSSMGEFEQARPVVASLKSNFPAYKIAVTFFSPSGYEACKNNKDIDYAFYLPQDNKKNAQRFIEIVNPATAIFIKYEFWYHYLNQLMQRRIPTFLVSGTFRPGQVFFKWYGGLFRQMLHCFTFFFLQDTASQRLLGTIGIDKNVAVTGDTRYDRVSAIATNISPIPAVAKFKGTSKILIAGSTWPGDEEVLKDSIDVLPHRWKVIIAPHEIQKAHIKNIEELFAGKTVLFSELNDENTNIGKDILVIDNIGMLSRLYAYGDIAFIGGGFQKGGIHNILEPAVFGLPVIFGPVYEKFVEAKKMASLRLVFPVSNAAECKSILKKLAEDEHYRQELNNLIKNFMQEHLGATELIMGRIKREHWLVG
jgi:3-deoxy-D-manno-octulosonic-acid transferase